ncbi:hypothetical protein BU14_0222s0006 [Porphyra umbilicalis]|uniref:Uncharacterized protein n=1 Tax=Porphyra umbilicalis TaxID=2786 RepID=A0A1X6P4F4_PORUM|nr:hypothetical protein BU14_0222s0006 [Porphyra umbilicalis]|eukprot:OSX75761.1 hypothetical protein BU14_0222s0006 [Porphyra umbilicalis]
MGALKTLLLSALTLGVLAGVAAAQRGSPGAAASAAAAMRKVAAATSDVVETLSKSDPRGGAVPPAVLARAIAAGEAAKARGGGGAVAPGGARAGAKSYTWCPIYPWGTTTVTGYIFPGYYHYYQQEYYGYGCSVPFIPNADVYDCVPYPACPGCCVCTVYKTITYQVPTYWKY